MKITLTSTDIRNILTGYMMDRFNLYDTQSIRLDVTGSANIDIDMSRCLDVPDPEDIPIKPGMMVEDTGQTTQFPKPNISTGEDRENPQDPDFDPEAPYGRKKDGTPKKKPGPAPTTDENQEDEQEESKPLQTSQKPRQGSLFSKMDPDKEEPTKAVQEAPESPVTVEEEEATAPNGNRNPFADSGSSDETDEDDPVLIDDDDTGGVTPVDEKIAEPKQEMQTPPKKRSLFNFDE